MLDQQMGAVSYFFDLFGSAMFQIESLSAMDGTQPLLELASLEYTNID
jgi:hypothetical protein